MELREVRTFRAVAEHGSLSRAASYLHMAQPALSRQVKQLEKELQQELFTRDGRGMHLTPAGAHLYERTAGLITGVDHLVDDIRSFDAQPSGQVVLGLVPTVSALIAAEVAVRTVEQFPQVRLRMSDGYSGHLRDWMNRGDLDLAVMYDDGPPSDPSHILIKERLCAVGVPSAFSGIDSQTAEEPNDAHTIALQSVLTLPLVLPSRQHPLRRIIEAGAQKTIDGRIDVVVEADSFRVLLGIAATGKGVTILPDHALHSAPHPTQLQARRLTGTPLSRTLALVRPPGDSGSVAVDAVAGIVRDLVYETMT